MSLFPIALNVRSLNNMTEHIRSRGIPVKEWTEEDKNGLVRYAQVTAFGNTTHTLIERNNYPENKFLPNWTANPLQNHLHNSLWSRLPSPGLTTIDHLAMNQLTGTMKTVGQW